MTAEDLYKLYAKWSGELHFYCVKHLGRHVDVEYFPNDYFFNLYSGRSADAQMTGWFGTTVPALVRPPSERRVRVDVPRPEANPSETDLQEAFRALCLAAARVLEADLGKERLPQSRAPRKGTVTRPQLKFPSKKTNESSNPKRRTLGPRKKKN